jgi:hypothetical protein
MYSKQEASKLRQAFWTAFGQYMALNVSAEGEKINWVNYKTGERYVQFKLSADNKTAAVAIEINHPDAGIRELYFDQFLQLKNIFTDAVQETWDWRPFTHDENGRPVSRIAATLEAVSVFKQDDWPAIISFLKPRLMALDIFWSNVKYSFEILR